MAKKAKKEKKKEKKKRREQDKSDRSRDKHRSSAASFFGKEKGPVSSDERSRSRSVLL